MKTSQIFFLSLLFCLMLFTACKGPGIKVSEPSEKENEILQVKGDLAAMTLVKSLKSEVKQAIETEGVAKAISVCNEKALPLTQKVAEQSNDNISIKRTSFKYRNPANAPDKVESMALNHYENLIRSGNKLPGFYTQKVIQNGDTSFYYYKPMKTEMLCLLCHGDGNAISPQVKSMLAELYPDDRATGYHEGDFRGLIRVKFRSL